jgi:dienelactone hydrolase
MQTSSFTTRRLVAHLIWLLALTGLTGASAQTRIQLNSKDPDGAARGLRAWLYLPEVIGKTPVPAVVALHGCGGLYSNDRKHATELSDRHAAFAKLLNEKGYAVLFPDSLTDRGIKTLCATKFSERRLHVADRVADAAAAVDALLANPAIDAKRLTLLGWSNGGSVTLSAVDSAKKMPQIAQLKSAIAFYPGCTAFARRASFVPVVPLQIHIGADDDWTPAAPCVALAARDPQSTNIKTFVYENAVHDFDHPSAPVRRRMDVPNGVKPGSGVLTGSNPLARELAYGRMLAFLKTTARPQ